MGGRLDWCPRAQARNLTVGVCGCEGGLGTPCGLGPCGSCRWGLGSPCGWGLGGPCGWGLGGPHCWGLGSPCHSVAGGDPTGVRPVVPMGVPPSAAAVGAVAAARAEAGAAAAGAAAAGLRWRQDPGRANKHRGQAALEGKRRQQAVEPHQAVERQQEAGARWREQGRGQQGKPRQLTAGPGVAVWHGQPKPQQWGPPRPQPWGPPRPQLQGPPRPQPQWPPRPQPQEPQGPRPQGGPRPPSQPLTPTIRTRAWALGHQSRRPPIRHTRQFGCDCALLLGDQPSAWPGYPSSPGRQQLWTVLRLCFLHAVWCVHMGRDRTAHHAHAVVAHTVAMLQHLMWAQFRMTALAASL
ncbi:Protein piccolo, partial [Tetrabaena socialis]